MSSIRQYQRRAAESVITRINMTVKHGPKILLNKRSGKKLHLLGISEGTGTCSDLHGINIAVFSEHPFDPKRHRLITESKPCHGAVLLRDPTEKEIREHRHEFSVDDQCLQAVEGLISVPTKGGNILRFKPNGKSALYVQLA